MTRRIGMLCLLGCCALALTSCGAFKEPEPSEMGRKGIAALEKGDAEEAYEILLQASVQNPDNQADALAMGDAALAAGKLEEAYMAYERALIIDDYSPKAKLGLARTSEKMGAPALARQYYLMLVRGSSGDIWREAKSRLEAMDKQN